MWDRPVVSLHGNGESVTLDNLSADWVLMQGATGLGVSPVELSTAPLAGGGSVLQHRRFTEAEIVVPILLGRSRFMDRFEQRRTLERLCDGLVEIRIETAEGTRSRWGWYSDGLQGDYGEGEDSIDGQKLALTFLCLDQFWKGEEHSFVYKTNAPKKPFLSVATNGRENLWDGKQLTDYTQSVWDVVDGGLEKAGEGRIAGLDLDDWRVDASEGTPFTVDLSLKFLTGDGKGKARIVGVSYKDGVKLSETTLMETNRSGRFGSSFYPATGADAVSIGLYVTESMGRDGRVRVSNAVLWGPTEPPHPPKWVEVARNVFPNPACVAGGDTSWFGVRWNRSRRLWIDEGVRFQDGADSPERIGYGVDLINNYDSAYYIALPEWKRLPVTPGETVYAGLRARWSGDCEAHFPARFHDGEKFIGGVVEFQSATFCPAGEWVAFEGSLVVPEGAKYLLASHRNSSSRAWVAGDYTDLAEVYFGNMPLWFSGDNAPDGMRSEWLGEPNNSASVLYELQ